jgi:hypothetical protein
MVNLYEDMGTIKQALDKVHFSPPSGPIKGREILDQLSDYQFHTINFQMPDIWK